MRLRRKPQLELSENRFGTARFATRKEKKRAGIYTKTGDAVYVGHDEHGYACYGKGQGGVVITASSRKGKQMFLLTPILCDGEPLYNVVILDPKPELIYMAQGQTNCHQAILAPRHIPGVGRTDHLNPASHLRGDEPDLYPLSRELAGNFLEIDEGTNARYFQQLGKGDVLAPIWRTQARQYSEVQLPRTADLVAGLRANNEDWVNFEYEMSNSPDMDIQAAAKNLEKYRKKGGASDNGGQNGIINEVVIAMQSINDPQIREMLSPPYTFDWSMTCGPYDPADKADLPWKVWLLFQQEHMQEGDAPVLRAILTSAMHHKRRALNARPQLHLWEEMAHLGSFQAGLDAFSLGAGFGQRPIGVLQHHKQANRLGKDGQDIVYQGASAQVWFGPRDLDSAEHISKLLGTAQVEYADRRQQNQDRLARRQAAKAFMHGEDPIAALQAYRAKREDEAVMSHIGRPMRMPNEILGAPNHIGYAWLDELAHPILLNFKPFWEWLPPGSYLDSPHFAHIHGRNRVPVRGRFGRTVTKRVLEADVPERFAHLHQFAVNKMPYRFVEGHEPK